MFCRPHIRPYRTPYTIVKSTDKPWITRDNANRHQLEGDSPVIAVGALPPVAEAQKDAIYIVKSTNEEWAAYDNVNWNRLAGGSADAQVVVVDVLPFIVRAVPNIIYIERKTGLEWITYDNLKWTCLNGSNENNRTLVRVVDSLEDLAESPADYMYFVKETHDLYFIFDDVEVPAVLNSFVLCDGSAAAKAASADAPDLLCFC
jgi:hypothetical protein